MLDDELYRRRLEVVQLRAELALAYDWMYHAQGWLRFVGSFRRAIGHTGFDALDEFTESCPLPAVGLPADNELDEAAYQKARDEANDEPA